METTSSQPLRRILFVSDVHAEEDEQNLRELVNLLDKLDPDMLILGGDIGRLEHLLYLLEIWHRRSPVKPLLYILGNNDDYDFTAGPWLTVSVHMLDLGPHCHLTKSLLGYNLVACGISRNIGLKPSPRRNTPDEYLSRARTLGEMISSIRGSVSPALVLLVIHEVPTEICEIAVKQGVIRSFNKKISETVSKAIEIIDPDLVLHGHLHAELLHAVRGRTHIVCTAWSPHRAFVLLELEKSFMKVKPSVYREGEVKILEEFVIKPREI